ncbi:MAG TPA: carboxymuconolactone decarboxylase family protein [Moorella mulderi]|nr:carboxymuconolactone decarboxylase family protein [Moorella mulderi]
MKLPPFMEVLAQRDEEFYQAVARVLELAHGPGALDPKTKTLISLALDACVGSERGVQVLSQRARELGATDQEINEVMRLVYAVVGSKPIIMGNLAFPSKG